MTKRSSLWLALLGSVALGTASTALAQDSGPLLDLLVKKGIVNDQEAEDLRADLTKQNLANLLSTSKGPNLDKLTITGRVQSQFVALNTDTNTSTVTKPASTEHFLLRRVYLGVKPQFGNGWSSYINYDFAGSTFDQATISWKKNDALALDVGFRKVPFGYDEWSISSGALKAIERSPITRFFVESNNGRRLGAGSYRQGVFVGGATPSGVLTYNVAVTNPERDETAAGAAGTGTSANNNLAYWGNVGYGDKFGEGGLNNYKVGFSAGLVTDQGGASNTHLGQGMNIDVYSVYADVNYNDFSLVAEYYWAKDTQGISSTLDSKPSGWWIQPSYRFGQFEAVVRYTEVNSDGRGIQPGDLVRSAPNPAGITMNKLNEWFLGFNWYILGNALKHDVKFQAGYIKSESTGLLSGPATVNKLTSDGFRSQFQVNF